ncbi:hypothetical protein MSAN_00767000 [Mycena sanguinolenta]|uniref:Uncharacterized protein n=1 Tax=Mycena sanguinolenta TaxID=230812 RepID=A0A8H6Z5E7_9AGAR|nr:hypothetical protein MSAN_00767000 [Mycena sanguinolenta]
MYHRQAAGFIERNRGAALSSESLQILSSYLGCKYVGHSTNLMVLQQLGEKLRYSEESRRVMVDDPVGLQLVVEMLESPFPEVRRLTCEILSHLVVHKSTVLAALLNFGVKLVTLICDEDDNVAEKAMQAFSAGIRFPSVVQAFIDTTLFDAVLELSESSRPFVRMRACTILGQVVGDTPIASTVVRNFVMKLLLLIRDEDRKVAEKAMRAFSEAVGSPTVAPAFIDTALLDDVLDLLESSRSLVRMQACTILGQFVVNTSTAPTVVRKFGMKLPLLMHDEDDNVVGNAMRVFSAGIRIPTVAQAFIDTKLFDSVSELLVLESPRPFVRTRARTILEQLVLDEFTACTAVRNFGMSLLPFIRDEDDKVVEKAMWAFSMAVRSPSGAQAFINAKLLDSVRDLLEWPRPFVRTQTCRLLGTLASHVQTTEALLKWKPCARLVVLLRDEDTYVVHAALYALTQISRTPSGAKAVLNAKALDYVPQLLGPKPMIRERFHPSDLLPLTTNMVQDRTNELLASLFRHEFAVPAILRLNICARMVSILQAARSPFPYDFHEIDYTSLTVATSLLARISEWPGGVSAVADTAVLDAIEWIDYELVLPLDNRVRADMRTIQDNVARYKDSNQKDRISS